VRGSESKDIGCVITRVPEGALTCLATLSHLHALQLSFVSFVQEYLARQAERERNQREWEARRAERAARTSQRPYCGTPGRCMPPIPQPHTL